ncbi:MAG TPA: ribonuclease HII [Erysipelotrichaceae bacterium]|nr:ribonuclease HII [Erysipelotrichaceae bacterium]
MNKYEKEYWDLNLLVCGIDEVGRGPIAGPLVVCGVVLPINFEDERINDSKKLSAKKREELYIDILDAALYVDVEVVNEKTVDAENIYQATKLAMERISNRSKANFILLDAMPINCDKANLSLIKGDSKSVSIAAASIVAKVIRDQIMINFDYIYPQYEFKNNKGYPTKKHKEALENYGYINIHRKSFNPILSMIKEENN